MYIDLRGAIKVLTDLTHTSCLRHCRRVEVLALQSSGFRLFGVFLFISLQNGIFKPVCGGQGTCALFT